MLVVLRFFVGKTSWLLVCAPSSNLRKIVFLRSGVGVDVGVVLRFFVDGGGCGGDSLDGEEWCVCCKGNGDGEEVNDDDDEVDGELYGECGIGGVGAGGGDNGGVGTLVGASASGCGEEDSNGEDAEPEPELELEPEPKLEVCVYIVVASCGDANNTAVDGNSTYGE